MPKHDDPLLDRYDLSLTEDESAFFYRGKMVNLTQLPFSLLLALFKNRGHIVIYRTLVKRMYGVDMHPATKCGGVGEIHTLQQHARKIRAKIGDEWVFVERGKGMIIYNTKQQLLYNRRVRNQDSGFSAQDRATFQSFDDPQPTQLVAVHNTSDAKNAGEAATKADATGPVLRKRNTKYENERSLDFKAFRARLAPLYGPSGYVTLAFPWTKPAPDDDFGFRVYKMLGEAGWPLNPHWGESVFDVSGYGVTLGAAPDKNGKLPPHLYTLRNALEKSGMPVRLHALSDDRTADGVCLIIGAEYP
jgi:hypothetical protein